MNPNYVGFTVIDWKSSEEYKIIDKGAISLKSLNNYDDSLKGKRFSSDSKERKYISNKRNYEIIDISHKLVKIAEFYKCAEEFSDKKYNCWMESKYKLRFEYVYDENEPYIKLKNFNNYLSYDNYKRNCRQ